VQAGGVATSAKLEGKVSCYEEYKKQRNFLCLGSVSAVVMSLLLDYRFFAIDEEAKYCTSEQMEAQ
jgi:hypothetical protein